MVRHVQGHDLAAYAAIGGQSALLGQRNERGDTLAVVRASSAAPDPRVFDLQQTPDDPPTLVLDPDQIRGRDYGIGEELLAELGTAVDLLDAPYLDTR